MRVIDLGGGHDEDYDDEIYDRRGAVDVADVRMGLTWVMVVEYTTTMARSMTAEWMS